MAHRYSSMFAASVVSLVGFQSACLNSETSSESALEVGVTAAALSVCDETVPADRNVDGIPSYKQCDASANSAIYSNNGVDTSTTQMGSDWVRTQWSGGYQCTELANRYLRFKWGVKWIPNGNAGMWCETQPPANSGLVQTMTPVHGDIMVLAPGSCGADATTGHVTVVDQVNDTKLVVVEQNGARRGTYNTTCGKCFLHVMANDGTGAPAAGAAGAKAPATTPPAMQGAAGGASTPSGFPGRGPRTETSAPSTPGAAMMAGAAGARAPTTPPAANAPAAQPTAAPVMANTSKPLLGTTAAGSGALAPLTNAVTTAPASAPTATVTESGCSVAAVGSKGESGLSLLATSMLLGLALRLRRRSTR